MRSSMKVLVASSALALAIVASARTTRGAPGAGQEQAAEYYPAAMLSHIGDSLGRGTATGHVLGAHPTYQYIEIRRGQDGVPEIHDRWIDVAVVQVGRATLVTGGHVTGGHLESAGEQRGGAITGGTSRRLGPGDLIVIPARIPHQFLIAAGDSLRYLTVKVLQP
jgi:mannose-6-phosphate isomerase-like protein (cupin superfamily)